jgi:hypothetical protein
MMKYHRIQPHGGVRYTHACACVRACVRDSPSVCVRACVCVRAHLGNESIYNIQYAIYNMQYTKYNIYPIHSIYKMQHHVQYTTHNIQFLGGAEALSWASHLLVTRNNGVAEYKPGVTNHLSHLSLIRWSCLFFASPHSPLFLPLPSAGPNFLHPHRKKTWRVVLILLAL